MLSRANFLSHKTIPRVEVQVPELGDSVFVRAMTARERDQFETANTKAKAVDFRARLVIACTCDETGVDVFKIEDLEVITNLSSSALDPIVTAALKINKYTDEDKAELEKNSETPRTPSTPSPSASQLTLD